MFFNDMYCRIRYRVDDPLRYLHVPRRHRVDVDEPTEEPAHDDQVIDLVDVELGEIVPEPDLA
ncbi:MAG: hypothetical protein AAGD18_12345 [Actinomycetota bacterium]